MAESKNRGLILKVLAVIVIIGAVIAALFIAKPELFAGNMFSRNLRPAATDIVTTDKLGTDVAKLPIISKVITLKNTFNEDAMLKNLIIKSDSRLANNTKVEISYGANKFSSTFIDGKALFQLLNYEIDGNDSIVLTVSSVVDVYVDDLELIGMNSGELLVDGQVLTDQAGLLGLEKLGLDKLGRVTYGGELMYDKDGSPILTDNLDKLGKVATDKLGRVTIDGALMYDVLGKVLTDGALETDLLNQVK